ncbi:hypothetical protein [Chromobacterium sphagni]|uniref:Uncharacterized protein n=1 Tax=Chromobacterium sphagni TaxID=1903179 RepID=A0ABX3CCB0_9NEIS|nr:hypothetical protein [Chromobacterium sphagni]OHX19637.1 hypothetical protein BI344_17315 [Chromobacterium sphagni]
MSITPIATQAPVPPSQTATAEAATPAPAADPAKVQLQNAPPGAVQDKVTISGAARALQEATETAAQTAKEANNGDRQAQRKLAAEEARRGVR